MWLQGDCYEVGQRTCCSLDDMGEARAAAEFLGIPHQVEDCSREFARGVIDPFVSEYRSGRTPNPCILCNREIKFGLLWEKAAALGADYLATGHHARIECAGGNCLVRRGIDEAKDQSYALFPLTHDQRSRTLLPIGHLTKGEVRNRARAAGLPKADKEESQDICFIPDGDYASFLESRGETPPPGPIRHVDGRILGTHRGIHRFTVGQRRGIGVPAPEPLYVTGIDPAKNEVRVGPRLSLEVPSFLVSGWLWHRGKESSPRDVLIQTRYRQDPARARLVEGPGGMLVTWVDEPRTVTPGQAAVAYEGDVLVGGGWILGPDLDGST